MPEYQNKFDKSDQGPIFPPEFQNMDEEEIIYHELYDMRRQAELIMNAIERVVPERYHGTFLKLNRINATKREKMYPVSPLKQKMKAQNFVLQFLSDGEFEDKYSQKPTGHALYDEYAAVMKAYTENKKIWLEKESDQNLLIGYLDDNTTQIPDILSFILNSIHDVFEKNPSEEKDDYGEILIQRFFSKNNGYGFIRQLD